jgi:hypothetical protein
VRFALIVAGALAARLTQGSGDLGVNMRLIWKFALLLPVVFASSPATSGEWKIIPTPKAPGYLFAEFRHDDDGRLFVMCDKEARLITISLVEPRATWKTGESIKVTLRSDVPIEHVSGDGRQPEVRCNAYWATQTAETDAEAAP